MVNLKKTLSNKGISIKAYASVLGISEKSAWNKLNGETEFTISEALKTKKELLPEYDLEYLFGDSGE